MVADDEELQQELEILKRNHMPIPWTKIIGTDGQLLVQQASLAMKASIVGRLGLMMLSCGTGAWRVRESMNTVAHALNIVCSEDIGLTAISYTCFDKGRSFSQSLSLANTGINTDKLSSLEAFVRDFERTSPHLTVEQVHQRLDTINQKAANYTPLISGLAAGMACGAFVFLLGGGLIEMFCSFFGAGLGNFVRAKLNGRRLTLFAGLAVAVSVACIVYLVLSRSLEAMFNVKNIHEAGYIGAMLFVIPGFPFITSGLDIAKLDMRSGIERLVHAVSIILVATLVGWMLAVVSHLQPTGFAPLNLDWLTLLLLRLPASFVGVFGFSVLFNSPPKMASVAAFLGAIANTLRLELVDLGHVPPAASAFIGALVAGLLASLFHQKLGYPRISLTVPAIVIMVPGLYMYRAMYYAGTGAINLSAQWSVNALMIVLCLPLGLILARVLLDKKWRYAE